MWILTGTGLYVGFTFNQVNVLQITATAERHFIVMCRFDTWTSLIRTSAVRTRLWYAGEILLHRQPLISSEDREMQLSIKAPVVKLPGGRRRERQHLAASRAYQGSWRGLTEGSCGRRWISNLKHNTFYLLLHSGKRRGGGSTQLGVKVEGGAASRLLTWSALLLHLLLSLQKGNKWTPTESLQVQTAQKKVMLN